jgi:hypothetical protein
MIALRRHWSASSFCSSASVLKAPAVVDVAAVSTMYHRTASQQRRGLERDQAHLAAGMWPLRFSHWQIKHDPAHVQQPFAAQ